MAPTSIGYGQPRMAWLYRWGNAPDTPVPATQGVALPEATLRLRRRPLATQGVALPTGRVGSQTTTDNLNHPGNAWPKNEEAL